MKDEKCLDHPWATDETGWCWKCEEDRSVYSFQTMEEPMEELKDQITWSVIEDLRSRSERGIKKYNTTLSENDHQNMLQHAYEEALDLAQYLKKEVTTLNTIQDMVKLYSSDAELGKAIRNKYGQK